MRMKTEIKLKKKFPFIYFHKRPMTDLEIIFDNVSKVQDLMFATFPIMVVAKIIGKIKKKS